MSSVTQRIKQIKQPYGGYLKLKEWEKVVVEDSSILFPEENIHASLVGLAVDYLTRFAMGTQASEAFHISLLGALRAKEEENALGLLKQIRGLDDKSIICACKLCGYDVCVRAGMSGFRNVSDINPNPETVHNVRIMVERSFRFLRKNGPVVMDGFTFEGGYTSTIDCGDGDFLTEDTLWDFKVSKESPKPSHTLQLLVYYIMGMHSIHAEFSDIKKLGIYNPRLNVAYCLDIAKIDAQVMHEVSESVIGYSCGTSAQAGEWTLGDLAERYGVSKAKITGSFFAYGLPYEKVGRSYRFAPEQVMEWELAKKSVPYGKNNRIWLPAYVEKGVQLKEELQKAKALGDRERVEQIKEELQERGYVDYSWVWKILGMVAGMIFMILLFFLLSSTM